MNYRYLVATFVALFVSLFFLFVGDGTDRGAGTSGVEYIVLRYFHALTWGLMALFFLLRARSVTWRNPVAYAALVSYIIFLIVTYF